MKNLVKYVQDENRGIFSCDFLLKIYLTSFVWKNILFDMAKKPFLAERRNCFKTKDNEGYKAAVKKM